VWKVVKDKVDKIRVVEAEGKDIKKKKESV